MKLQRTADRAARAAGTVYRVVAGTETLGGTTAVRAASITSTLKSEDISSSSTTTNTKAVIEKLKN